MSVGTAIYNRLNASSDVTNIISNRIYPLVIPQDAQLPAITYQKISNPTIHAMGQDPSLVYPRYQINSFSTSYSQCKTLAGKIRNALRDYSGSTGGFEIQRIFWDNEIEFSNIDQEKAIYQIAQDYIIWHTT